jgi:hypothetical protein
MAVMIAGARNGFTPRFVVDRLVLFGDDSAATIGRAWVRRRDNGRPTDETVGA